jgi:3' terminal RNA ribose 2'-O-methyltransferase Hen1
VLLTITTTTAPATDLGFLLHKHPDKVQRFGVSSGTAYVFYPEASQERCTAALLVEVDPVALVRGPGDSVTQYVNDRPYAASSLLSVALKSVFGTALAGRCAARPELAASAIPLEIRVPALRCAGGPELAERLLRPLGWDVGTRTLPLDPPSWGWSHYVDLRLTGTLRLADALNHLYLLLPVLDDAKHYWVSTDEVDKLIRAGAGWLAAHPEKELITRRYLLHQRALTSAALARLAESDGLDPADVDNAVPEPDPGPAPDAATEGAAEETAAGTAEQAADAGEAGRPVPLAVLRRQAVLAVLREAGARTVADLGCGEGALTGDLLRDDGFTRVIATDVSARALAQAARRLRLDRMPEARRARLTVFQSSLTYRDARLAGLDAAVLMEVIEHVEEDRLAALERSVFGFAAPAAVVVTTPNREYNPAYGMAAGTRRHRDHRFEWDRAEFAAWADRVAAAYGYRVRHAGAGQESPDAGPPTQLAVFTRTADTDTDTDTEDTDAERTDTEDTDAEDTGSTDTGRPGTGGTGADAGATRPEGAA